MRRITVLTVFLVAAIVLSVVTARLAFGHGGAIEVGGGAKGPVTLTDAQIKALDLKTAEATTHAISKLLGVPGEVQPLPNAQAVVNLRISGTVLALDANVGDVVRKGGRLALVQSRVVGNPPPVVPILSPVSGTIDTRPVSVGQSVEPGTTLYQISGRQSMRIVGKVYEEDLGSVHVGQKAYVTLLAYPKQTRTGTVSFVGPALDEETRTVEVWILLDNTDGLLRPNLFARADIVLGENTAALVVPNGAVLEANGEKFVFVREGNKFNRVEVEVGASDDEYSEIVSGLVPGDAVVTQGVREVYTAWLTGGRTAASDSD
jgi:multidrug efflux pump subunit AcrA (membrane-fusion protein)